MEDLGLFLGVGITIGFVCLALFKARRSSVIFYTILLIVGALALIFMFAQG